VTLDCSEVQSRSGAAATPPIDDFRMGVEKFGNAVNSTVVGSFNQIRESGFGVPILERLNLALQVGPVFKPVLLRYHELGISETIVGFVSK
jgi:hypothetical protein